MWCSALEKGEKRIVFTWAAATDTTPLKLPEIIHKNLFSRSQYKNSPPMPIVKICSVHFPSFTFICYFMLRDKYCYFTTSLWFNQYLEKCYILYNLKKCKFLGSLGRLPMKRNEILIHCIYDDTERSLSESITSSS
eukprot:TRINITY_DN5377_c0_g1_i1.p1 TRINITY_DN5377_c0_g1~~TRINITY_DN5377_c0_g1_i1.p1  ORF type:complete len:136 (+),score=5.87 TRINITY_DN5377_c0_g1_i1:248-655(+)